MINLFKTQQYFVAFDREIRCAVNPLDFIESSTSYVIDVSRLKVDKYKNLFVQVFLTQLQFLINDYEADTAILPKTLILPHLHQKFNQRTNLRSHTTMNEMFAEFFNLQMPVIAESNQCADIHESLHVKFETIIALQCTQYKHRRLLGSLLKFDGKFTNTSQQSSRESSYMYQFLTSLDLDKGIIYRAHYQKSYVFCFNQLAVGEKQTKFILPQNLPSHGKHTAHLTSPIPDPAELTTSLGLEFSKYPSLLSDLHIFLIDCGKQLSITKVIPKHVLQDDLELLLDKTLRGFYPDVKQRKEKAAAILEELIDLRYFPKNLQTGRIYKDDLRKFYR